MSECDDDVHAILYSHSIFTLALSTFFLFIMAPLRIGMIGGGTVGGGVYEIIMNRLSSKCIVTKLCVQNLKQAARLSFRRERDETNDRCEFDTRR